MKWFKKTAWLIFYGQLALASTISIADEEVIQVTDYRSKATRKRQHYYASAGLSIFAPEVRTGLYLPFDTTLELGLQIRTASVGFMSDRQDSSGNSETSTSATLGYLRLRKFLSNSFFVSIEEGMGTLSVKERESSGNNNSNSGSKKNTASKNKAADGRDGAFLQYFGFGMGNEWIVRHMIIGFEWFNVGVNSWQGYNESKEKYRRTEFGVTRIGTFSIGVTF